MWRPEIHISMGFFLLASWFGIFCSWQMLGVVLSAVAVHELGHLLALRGMRVKVYGFHLGVMGAVLETDSARLSYGREILCLLAGPGANLVCAMAAAATGGAEWNVWIGANVTLCAFNLLPAEPLDGGRALHLAVSWMAGPVAGDRSARCIGSITAAAMAAGMLYVMLCTKSVWLLPPTAGFLAAAVRMWGEGGWKVYDSYKKARFFVK